MGFQRLETFIDTLYKESKQNLINASPFRNKTLGKLKLVIDGNELPYAICKELYRANEYSGNYNQIYKKAHEMLSSIKPYIEIIIFDGSKVDAVKRMKRFEEGIQRLRNQQEKSLNPDEYLELLKGIQPLFMKNVIYEVINQLGINYSMTEGTVHHAIACYANGHNPTQAKFTVLARNSFFYVYNLECGYLSNKYFINYLKDPKLINDSIRVPIFYVNDLLAYLDLKNYKTWLYFCILLGDYDYNLERNITYLKWNNLDTKNNNLMSLVNHLKQYEHSLLHNDFYLLRSSYKSDEKLKKIDDIIDLFEFKALNFDFIINDQNQINDFDRFIINIKDLEECYLPCLVEDSNEKTVFNLCQENESLKHLYSFFSDEIVEYSRTAVLTSLNCLNTCKISTKTHPDKFNDAVLFYLKDMNKMNSADQVDNMTLLFTALATWYDWLSNNNYNNKLYNKSSDLFINSIVINLIIIKLKQIKQESCCSLYKNSRYDSLLKDLESNADTYDEILNVYDKILNSPNETSESYLATDLKIVHRLNEFQASYYVLGLVSSLNDFQYEFLSPFRFFDGVFVCKYIQECNVDGTDCFWLSIRLEENKLVQQAFEEIKNEFKKCLAFVSTVKFDEFVVVPKREDLEEEAEDLTHLIETLSI